MACGPNTSTSDDAGGASDAADAASSQRVCDPRAPECGGQEWQFFSDAACPNERPDPVTSCAEPGTDCYYCGDPDAAESEPGHSFTVMTCNPNTELWQVQELSCAT
mgnify:FL=1